MCKIPCKECPFRKDSIAGWLGEHSYNPQVFIDALEYDIIPCHMKVEWDTVEEKNLIVAGEQNPCIGALQFCANSVKFPRGARLANTPYSKVYHTHGSTANPEIFKWQADFIKHHSKK